ncbi:hypothetical protein L1887_15309 [Cichorium endivia]|nr:hypothetical protein L1887_15309 [Cichorium endivia]
MGGDGGNQRGQWRSHSPPLDASFLFLATQPRQCPIEVESMLLASFVFQPNQGGKPYSLSLSSSSGVV